MKFPPAWKVRRELVRVFNRLMRPVRYAFDLARQTLYDARFDRLVKVTANQRPLADRVAIFVIFQPNGIAASTFFTLDHLVEQGFEVVVVCNGAHQAGDIRRLGKNAALIVERPNLGYDFGGYRDGLRVVKARAENLQRLVFLNDSTWFPLRAGDDTLARMDATCKMLVGHILKTENETKPGHDHVESHLLMFSGDALASPPFKDFWAKLVISNRRDATIARGEKQITQTMLAQGAEAKGLLSGTAILEMLEGLTIAELRDVAQNVVPSSAKSRAIVSNILKKWETDEGASQEFLDWVHHALSNSLENLLSAAFVNPAMRYGMMGFVKKANDIRFHLARQEVPRMEQAGLIAPLHPAVREEMQAMVKGWQTPAQTGNTAQSGAIRRN